MRQLELVHIASWNVQPLQKTVWQFPYKVKLTLTLLPSNPIPGYLPQKNENVHSHENP